MSDTVWRRFVRRTMKGTPLGPRGTFTKAPLEIYPALLTKRKHYTTKKSRDADSHVNWAFHSLQMYAALDTKGRITR